MKKAIFFTLIMMLLTATSWSQTTDQNQRIREHAESILNILDETEELLISNLNAEWTDEKLMLVQWDSGSKDVPIDIEFYDPQVHRPWQLSVMKYNDGTILSGKNQHPIGLGRNDTDQHSWMIRIVSIDQEFVSEPFELPAREEEDRPDEQLVTIIDNKNPDGTFSNDQYNITGILDFGSETRVYYRNRANRETGFFESENLTDWSEPKSRQVPYDMIMIQADDKIYCYTTEGNSAFLWDDFNPDKGCENRLWKMYEWRIDGTLPPSYLNGEFVQLGRVRGYGPQNEGGWGDDRTEYPRIEDFPEVAEAFGPFPYWDAEDYLQDRRGLSIHRSEDERNWSSRILADPENIDLPGFRGWKKQGANGIADFYSAVMVQPGRAFVKVYWKEKDRLMDRKIEDNVRRRFRFTGETTFIPAVIENGNLNITSTQSIIPKEYHERIVTPDMVQGVDREPLLTNPGVPEVGQLTPENRIIIRDGKVHIFYFYRDDIHYEGGWDGQHEGVYMHIMDEIEFNNLFK